MTETAPTFRIKQMAFFSDWYVDVRWPDGEREKVTGFSSEPHAKGWVEHESAAWIATNKKAYHRAATPTPVAAIPQPRPTNGVGVSLNDLAEQFEQASAAYAKANDLRRDPDWFVLKLQEEVGELTQVWVKLTGRGRLHGRSTEELRQALADETADVLGHILLLARAEGIDLDAAIERKWRFRPAKAPA